MDLNDQYCERCSRKLDPNRIVWLEYDQRTGTYTDKEVPAEFSQGGFPFGKDCADIVLAEHEAAQLLMKSDETVVLAKDNDSNVPVAAGHGEGF